MSAAPDTRAPNPHHVRLRFGRHNGERITRAPASYLKWMVNAGTEQADVAEAELARRGHVLPEIEISGHAIDRVSLQFRKRWHQTRGEHEGLHAWLVRVAQEALVKVDVDQAGQYHHLGLRFVFGQDGRWPVLKTVLPEKRKHPHEREIDETAPQAGEES